MDISTLGINFAAAAASINSLVIIVSWLLLAGGYMVFLGELLVLSKNYKNGYREETPPAVNFSSNTFLANQWFWEDNETEAGTIDFDELEQIQQEFEEDFVEWYFFTEDLAA